MKPLKRSDFNINIVEDLGMVYSGKNAKTKSRMCIAECAECKKNFKAFVHNLKKNKTSKCKSCRHKTHGSYGDRLYVIYRNMIQRTKNKNNPHYKHYGYRGITICSEWSTFDSFKEWALSNGYKHNLTIDRIDNYGNYEPSNCRWTTQSIQTRNTRPIRSINTSGYRGVHFCKQRSKFKSRITINGKRIYLGAYEDARDAAIAFDKYITENNLEHARNFNEGD